MDTGHGEAATSGADAGGVRQPVLVVIYTGWWNWNMLGNIVANIY